MDIAGSNGSHTFSSLKYCQAIFQSGRTVLSPTSNPWESQFLHYVFYLLCFNAWAVISPLTSWQIVLNIPCLFTRSLLGWSLLDQTFPESLYSLCRDAYSWTEHPLHPYTSLMGCSLLDQTSPASLYSLWWDAHSRTEHPLHSYTFLVGCSLLKQAFPASLYSLWRDAHSWTEQDRCCSISFAQFLTGWFGGFGIFC